MPKRQNVKMTTIAILWHLDATLGQSNRNRLFSVSFLQCIGSMLRSPSHSAGFRAALIELYLYLDKTEIKNSSSITKTLAHTNERTHGAAFKLLGMSNDHIGALARINIK